MSATGPTWRCPGGSSARVKGRLRPHRMLADNAKWQRDPCDIVDRCDAMPSDTPPVRESQMSSSDPVVVRDKRRLFDGFFKLDELAISHRRYDGSMSREQRVLVFERGDSVAAVILNRSEEHTSELQAHSF